MSRKRTVEERAQELRSKWAKLQVESATLKSMYIEDGMLDMTVDGARDLVLRMGVALRMTFDYIGATNYAQMTVNDPNKNSEHGQFLLTIQSANRPTPNELKVQAEKERDELKQLLAAEVERLNAENTALLNGYPEYADPQAKSELTTVLARAKAAERECAELRTFVDEMTRIEIDAFEKEKNRADLAECQYSQLREALTKYVPIRRPPLLREDGAYICLQGVDTESHRTCGSRSWSYEVTEWCSADAPCSACESPNGDLDDLRKVLAATPSSGVKYVSQEEHERTVKALERELERWRHDFQVEGDYICPDSLRAQYAESQVESLKVAASEASEFLQQRFCKLEMGGAKWKHPMAQKCYIELEKAIDKANAKQ